MTADRRLRGQRVGEGPPLLLVHGVGGCWQHWSPMLPGLARHHDTSAVDLPGFGGSPPLDSPTIDALADALEDHLDALGWQRTHLAGNSLGGLLVLELARRGRALTTTTFSPTGMAVGWERAWARGMLRLLTTAARGLGPLLDTFMRNRAVRLVGLAPVIARPGRVDPALAAAMAAALRDARSVEAVLAALEEETTSARLDEVDGPVTVAWGTRDRVLPPRQGARLKRAMPEARLVRLPGLGHVPMVDDPRLCVRTVLATTVT